MEKWQNNKESLSMMKKIILFTIFFFCFFVICCTPGVFFDIKNCTGETIEINYVICDDLLYSGVNFDVEKMILKKLENEETLRIIFSLSKFNNRGVTKEDYCKTETILSIFEDITIKYLENNVLFNKDDLRQFNIQYSKKITTHFFTLLIENASVTVTKFGEERQVQ